MKRIIISVTNDVVTDQRILRHALALSEQGIEVTIAGRLRKGSLPASGIPFRVRRFRILFNRGPLFYATFNIRLLIYLLFSRADALVANDLDTLLANFIASRVKRCRLWYDSHEYFTGVPELVKNGFAWTIWKTMEKMILPRLKHMYTVNESIATLYRREYHIDVKVVRNIPARREVNSIKTRDELGLPLDKKIVILQGAWINIDRGAEEAVEAMQHLEGIMLLIIGGGDVMQKVRQKVVVAGLEGKVLIKDKMPYNDLVHYTANADIGLSLDKDSNINYRYSLPNKLFDYIQARIPVLASNVVEVAKIVEGYNVGTTIDTHDPARIAEKIKNMLDDSEQMAKWKANLEKAAEELCWEKEKGRLLEVFGVI